MKRILISIVTFAICSSTEASELNACPDIELRVTRNLDSLVINKNGSLYYRYIYNSDADTIYQRTYNGVGKDYGVSKIILAKDQILESINNDNSYSKYYYTNGLIDSICLYITQQSQKPFTKTIFKRNINKETDTVCSILSNDTTIYLQQFNIQGDVVNRKVFYNNVFLYENRISYDYTNQIAIDSSIEKGINNYITTSYYQNKVLHLKTMVNTKTNQTYISYKYSYHNSPSKAVRMNVNRSDKKAKTDSYYLNGQIANCMIAKKSLLRRHLNVIIR